MFAFKFEAHTKVSVRKQNCSSDKQLFQLINCLKCCPLAWTHPQPWLPVINGLVNDALFELRPERN